MTLGLQPDPLSSHRILDSVRQILSNPVSPSSNLEFSTQPTSKLLPLTSLALIPKPEGRKKKEDWWAKVLPLSQILLLILLKISDLSKRFFPFPLGLLLHKPHSGIILSRKQT
jgi:hypothetical protein